MARGKKIEGAIEMASICVSRTTESFTIYREIVLFAVDRQLRLPEKESNKSDPLDDAAKGIGAHTTGEVCETSSEEVFCGIPPSQVPTHTLYKVVLHAASSHLQSPSPPARPPHGNGDPPEECCMAVLAITKMEICRYYESSSGCMRGERCYFAHGDGELRRPIEAHVQEELKRKIFIGGLSPSVTSDVLGEFFEIHFGPVKDAVVIGSQAGEHIHPRGFGFVTFKNEESVAAAVEIHFVTILGKKVEIKGAVPKSMIGISSATSSENAASLWSQPQPQPFRQLSGGMALEEADDSRKQLVSWVDKLRDGIPVDAVSNLSKLETPWVRKFVKWLPDFLGEVYKRLKDGECYPLSSLKGDFRATCGMELDHASLGYQKLSDFVRSLTGICRMKIVPVGRGPATHMVLLEPHHRLDRDSRTPTTGFEPEGCDYKSYADALYHGVARHDATSRTSKEETTNLVAGDWFGVAEERRLSSAKMAGVEIAKDENERLLSFLRSDGSVFTPWQPPGDMSTWGRRLSVFCWTFRSYFQTSPRDFLLAKKLEVD